MWEDTFTGVFKFRARWLTHALDLRDDVLPRLEEARRAFANSDKSGNDSVSSKDRDAHDDELFLTPKMEDLEVRLIVKPITLSVTTSPSTEIPVEWKGKTGPSLTHTFDDSTGDFAPLEGTDPILKRARVRQSEAVAFASRANQEHEAAKNGQPIVKNNGWLLPKREIFDRRGRGNAGRRHGGGIRSASTSPSTSTVPAGSAISDMELEGSDESGPEEEELSSSKDEEWKQGDDSEGDTTDTDDDSHVSPTQATTTSEVFTPRKSARQRKPQRSPAHTVKGNSDSEGVSPCVVAPSTPSSQRRIRSPPTKHDAPLLRRYRRLAMPPVSGDPVLASKGECDSRAAADPPAVPKNAQLPKTRVAAEPRVKNSLALPRTSSTEALSNTARKPLISGKRKRGGAAKMAEAADPSDYPPRHSLVGEEFQAEIPELLSAKEIKTQSSGTGARMVS